jgi:hypothetical protein
VVRYHRVFRIGSFNRSVEELKNSFKKDYHKLLNEPRLPRKNELEPADPSWANLPRGLDVNSMLAQVKNDYGHRLNYLYFVYRIASFDTHGKQTVADHEYWVRGFGIVNE